jgi:hypothetical protein
MGLIESFRLRVENFDSSVQDDTLNHMWLGQNRKGYFNLLKSKGQELFHLNLKPNLEKLKIFILRVKVM